jgi:hypothetical protein
VDLRALITVMDLRVTIGSMNLGASQRYGLRATIDDEVTIWT